MTASVLRQLDTNAVTWVCLRRRRHLDLVMRWCTRAGNGTLWWLIGISTFLLDPRGGPIVARLAIAFAFELSLYKVLKQSLRRPRPYIVLAAVTNAVAPPDEFSFPSGHTAAATVVLTVVGSVYPGAIFVLAPLAALIAISRVYLGMHYPSDVVAGALLGIAAGSIALVIPI
ncbi:MAG TPA: phosphatase PAP2 family protein [Bacteroidota bacterium]|nr:phosphatase PAP2 family protein [Bacteroidota bacterium]